MMTRRHFILIAQTLRDDAVHSGNWRDFEYETATEYQRGAYDQWSTTVLAMAAALATTNPNFDRGRFLYAAGLAVV